MKQIYNENLETMRKYMHWDNTLTEEENKKNGEKYFTAVDFLCKSKDQEVLEHLLDFFSKENENCGSVCESLKAQIGTNYTLEQLITAFYKKFDSLIKKSINRCVQISWHMFTDENFEKFRKMFNTVKSEDSEKFLQEIHDWAPEEENYINILRDDMKEWK
jgi:hypothetical protein